MNRTISRVLWVIAGIILIAAGIYCLISPAAAITGMAMYFGIAMLISGIVDVIIFAGASRFMAGSGGSWWMAL